MSLALFLIHKFNVLISFRNRKFSCVKCEKMFNLQKQLDSHNCKMKYSCTLCNKYFLKETELCHHLKDKHDQHYIVSVN